MDAKLQFKWIRSVKRLEAARRGVDVEEMDRACTRAEKSAVSQGWVGAVRRKAQTTRAALLKLEAHQVAVEAHPVAVEESGKAKTKEGGGGPEGRFAAIRRRSMGGFPSDQKQTSRRLQRASAPVLKVPPDDQVDVPQPRSTSDLALYNWVVDEAENASANNLKALHCLQEMWKDESTVKWIKAVAKLNSANSSNSPQEMEWACYEAERNGVSSDWVAAVRHRSHSIQGVLSRLEVALQSNADIDELESALRHAEAFGASDDPRIATARRNIRKNKAELELEDALWVMEHAESWRHVELDEVALVCNEAEDAGVDADKIAYVRATGRLLEAESLLDTVEQRDNACDIEYCERTLQRVAEECSQLESIGVGIDLLRRVRDNWRRLQFGDFQRGSRTLHRSQSKDPPILSTAMQDAMKGWKQRSFKGQPRRHSIS